MTRERRLAVQMWREIAEKIKNSGRAFDVTQFKFEFCKNHNLNWLNHCYLCQYASKFCYGENEEIILNCNRCPLKFCEKRKSV